MDEINAVNDGDDSLNVTPPATLDESGYVTGEGAKTIAWNARKDWKGHLSTNATIQVQAYYTNCAYAIPWVYMDIDLTGGQTATKYPVSYSMTAPVNNTQNKSTHLWLRRIPGGTYMMGSPTNEYGRSTATPLEPQHTVNLSDFFIGVFPVTQAQYVKVISKTAPNSNNGGDYAPVNYVCYNEIRGTNTKADGTGTVIDWPNNTDDLHIVGTNSFLAALRSRMPENLPITFDLPLEAQWEYACRAGTAGSWNNGTDIGTTQAVYWVEGVAYTNGQYDLNLANLGWFGNGSVPKGNTSSAQTVGLKEANRWGLYDCHGNAWEKCLDRLGNPSNNGETDPKGVTSGHSYRIDRGGAWSAPASSARSASRAGRPADEQGHNSGFRLAGFTN